MEGGVKIFLSHIPCSDQCQDVGEQAAMGTCHKVGWDIDHSSTEGQDQEIITREYNQRLRKNVVNV